MKEKALQVLLVEDNAGDVRLLLEMFSGERPDSFELTHLLRMSEAVIRLAKGGVDIVLLDMGLPDGHGLDTVRRARAVAPGVPVIVLTGLNDEALAAEAMKEGAQDYLIKGQIENRALPRALRHAIERHRMQTETDLIRTHQMQFKDEFLSHVSHELRSPLAVVHQFVSILLDGLGGPINANQKEYLEIELRNVNQLKGMIDDLLDASRADTCKLTVKQSVISVGDVLKQTIRSFRETVVSKGISLQADIPDNLPPVYADPGRICQVVTNLLDNAVKFSPSKSTITVQAGILEEDPTHAWVSVADCGCGIEPEESERIFDRLYQAKNSLETARRGLGLGLYICKELISLQGGRIWSDSKRRGGCTISFTLPVFSIGNLIAPIVKQDTLIDSSFALVRIEVRAVEAGPSERRREQALSRIHQVIGRCILPDLDVLLPLQKRERLDLFFIVARTNQKGADVIVKRIREQISLCEDFKLADTSCSVSSEILRLSATESEWPLERQVQSVVSWLEKMLQVETTQRSG
jgi:sigma-B regulation protein RsbU (phosphoserine phosphatase)